MMRVSAFAITAFAFTSGISVCALASPSVHVPMPMRSFDQHRTPLPMPRMITVVDAPVQVTPAKPIAPPTPRPATRIAAPATAAAPAAPATAATAAAPATAATPPAPDAPAAAEAPIPLANLELGHDWTFTRAADGSYWRLRKTGGGNPGMWGAGLALSVASWAIALATNGWAPVVGGFISAGYYSDGTTKTLCVFNGIVGVGSAVMFAVGLATGSSRIERQPVTVVPIALAGGGQGAALSARF